MALPLLRIAANLAKGYSQNVLKSKVSKTAVKSAKNFFTKRGKSSKDNTVKSSNLALIGSGGSGVEGSRKVKPKISPQKLLASASSKTETPAASVSSTDKVDYEKITNTLDKIVGISAALDKAFAKQLKEKQKKDKKENKKIENAKKKSREEKIEKRKSYGLGKLGGAIAGVGSQFGIFNFLKNIALGSLVLFLLDNADKIEKIFNSFSGGFGEIFNLIKYSINTLTTVFGNATKTLIKASKNLVKITGKSLFSAGNFLFNSFKRLGVGLVGFGKKIIEKIAKTASSSAGKTAAKTSTASAGKMVSRSASTASSKFFTKRGATRLSAFSRVFRKIPILGALIGIGIDLAMGEKLDRAIVGAIGSSLGAALGGAIGQGLIPIPFVGAALGGVIGAGIGDWISKSLYDKILQMVRPVDVQHAIPPDNMTWRRSLDEGPAWSPPEPDDPNATPYTPPESGTDLLAKLVLAEAGGEGKIGMALVARSVLNRSSLIKNKKASAGTFHAQSGMLSDVITANNGTTWQYTPVKNGSINDSRSASEMRSAYAAIQLAQNDAQLRSQLKSAGVSDAQIGKLMASTGFRNYRAGAGYDPSQDVNQVNFKNHTFNTAGNPNLLTPTPSSIQTQTRGTPTLTDKIPYSQFSKTAAQGGTGPVGVTDRYGDRGGSHKGIDIGTSGGTDYYVSLKRNGKVTYVGTESQHNAAGNMVIISDSDNASLEYVFMHLKRSMVKSGQQYSAGTVIGQIGSTGRSTGEHLHFEVRVNNKHINPEPYLKFIEIGKLSTSDGTTQVRVADLQRKTQNPQTISRQASYEAGSSRVLMLTPQQIQQGQMVGGVQQGGPAILMGPSTKDVVNSYYKAQLMGFLYKQG